MFLWLLASTKPPETSDPMVTPTSTTSSYRASRTAPYPSAWALISARWRRAPPTAGRSAPPTRPSTTSKVRRRRYSTWGCGGFSRLKYFILLLKTVFVGDSLDVLVPSESVCGRDKSKTMTSAILFHCKPGAGVGIPEFLLETDGCQYLFVWHTNKVCELL